MERGSHGVISGADASGGGDNKDKGKDRDSSRRVNESEGEEYSEFEDDTLSERSSVHVYTVNQKTASYSDESAMDVELPDSESEGAISAPLTVTSPRGAKNSKSPIVYSDDFSYLNSLSRQERRRIEGEIIKGRKLALTVQNIVQELRGVDLLEEKNGKNILGIPSTKLTELKSAHRSTDEQQAAIVRYWLLRDSFASWRQIIFQLDTWAGYISYGHFSNRADRIRHYAEELTDTAFTHSNLSTVLNPVVGMDDLMTCLNIPSSVRDRIPKHCNCDDKQQERDEYIHYYRKYSPYSLWGWEYLGGELHYLGQEAALTAAKAYIQKAPEPSLTLDDLTSIIDGVHNMNGVCDWLQIPISKRVELNLQYDRRQLPRAYSTYFLTEHPCPSWSIVAFSLWKVREHGALEMLQKLYLKGSSESRRLLQVSMKRGYVDMYTDKMALYGSAGVGKTCTMKIVAGEKPTDIRDSTPVAIRPVIMYQLQNMCGEWRKYVSKDRMKLCARISKTTLGWEIIEALTKSQHEAEAAILQNRSEELEVGGGSEQKTSTAENSQQPTVDTTTKSESPANTTRNSVKPDVLQVIHDVLDEMFQLIDECPETEEPLSFIHKLLVSDCGGQPQFHEVLPIFLRRMSLIMFVFKLSEDLSSRPMIEYYEDGKPLGTPYESDLTTEQLIKQGLQSLHTHRSSGKDCEAPRIVMVGTHKDEEGKCSELRETKNENLQEMLLPTFEKEIIYYQPGTNKVLFPMNAKCPGKEEEDMARSIISRFSTENRSDMRPLPLQWLGFEIMLEEITQRLKRGVLSRSECLEVAYRLHLDESALDAALIYLDELSLVFYYPDILPEVIFTNPQVLLDKISELVKVHHDKLVTCTGEDWQKFFCHALVTVEFLQHPKFEKHYVPGLFEPEQLADLYRKLLIFADFSNEGIYFVPSLLRMLSSKEVADHRLSFDSLVAPLLLHFPDGPPRRGIFCALVSFFTSPENHFPGPWKLKKPARSVTPTCLHRNCIQFSVPGFKTACSVTLIDTLLHFEIHFNVKSQESALKFCPIIKQAISAGIRKANAVLGYTDSTPSFALLCPCGEGDPHPATIGDGGWICSSDEDVGEEFTPNQQIWLKGLSPAGDSASPAVVGRPRLHELDLIASKGKAVNVIGKVAYSWEKVATRLYFEEHDISRIQRDKPQAEDACRTMFIEWLEGKGRTPTTWETVIQALNEARQGELAKDLKEVLDTKYYKY